MARPESASRRGCLRPAPGGRLIVGRAENGDVLSPEGLPSSQRPPASKARSRTDPGSQGADRSLHVDVDQLPIVLCPVGHSLRNPMRDRARTVCIRPSRANRSGPLMMLYRGRLARRPGRCCLRRVGRALRARARLSRFGGRPAPPPGQNYWAFRPASPGMALMARAYNARPGLLIRDGPSDPGIFWGPGL